MSEKNERLDRALEFIKSLPGYPATQLKIIEGEEAINAAIASALPIPPGAERLDYALKILDNCAESYTSLVRDQKTYEAFRAIGWGLECRAWSLYCNGFDQAAHAVHAPALQAIRARLRHWVKRALQRWHESETQQSLVAPVVNARRQFVEPILLSKGWSIADWAKDANVDHATAMDYLDHKTNPYPDTRAKLARSLNVPVERLP